MSAQAATAPASEGDDPAVAPTTGTRSFSRRAGLVGGSTPDRLRRWSVVLGLACVAFAVVGSLVVSSARDATARVHDNTGPVLVTTQSVLASLAEADAAAVAAFVNPSDPRPRRAYLDAIARTNEQLEQVSALIGADAEAHDALQDLTVEVTGYAGLVEAGRTAQLFDEEAARDLLALAGARLSGDVARHAQRLEDATLVRLDADDVGDPVGRLVAAGIGLVVLALLARVQVRLVGMTRRLVNPGLAAATVLVLVALAWQVGAIQSARSSFAEARDDGFGSLLVTSDVQKTGFGALRDELVGLVRSGQEERDAADATAERLASGSSAGGATSNAGLLVDLVASADTVRERATAIETLERWRRYRSDVAQVRARGTDDDVAALVSSFNGFTFSVEAVLGDNRDQFLQGLDDATGALGGIGIAALVLPLLAAAGALGGLQVRINEYR